MGLGYVHAFALADEALSSKVRIRHEFYDIREMTTSQIVDEMLAASPDLVGFGCYVWNTPEVFEIAARLKERAGRVRILLGGPEVDFQPDRVLAENPGVDFVSVGEGEENFRELVHVLLDGGEPGQVPGIAIRRESGSSLARTRPPAKSLDAFPSPYLSGVMEVDPILKGGYFQTTRGCPFKCAYCDYGRSRPCGEFSLERAFAELDFFKAEGAEKLFCVDATFNMKNERAIRMLNRMADTSLKSALWIEAHPNLLDEAFVRAVGRTHCTYLGLGLQTINPEAMKNINRKWDPDRIGRLLDTLALEESCLLGLEIIMGLPGDNLASFKEALNWVYGKNPTNVFAFNLEVLPQTTLYDEAERFGIKEGGVGSSHEIISNHTFPAEQILVGKAMTEWNRQMQPVFYRLVRVTGLPAGDLIEDWAWRAYHAGLHEHLTDLHSHRVEKKLLERMAVLFEQGCVDWLGRAGKADVSLPLREFLRYYYTLRSVTSERSIFIDALDVHCITLDPKDHRILGMDCLKGKGIPEEAREETFAFDMERVWPMCTAEELSSLKPEEHTYLFLTNEKGGAMVVQR